MKLVEYPYGPNAMLFRVEEEPSRDLTLGLEYVAKQLRLLPQVLEARISYVELLVVLIREEERDLIRTKLLEIAAQIESGNDSMIPTRLHKIWVSYSGPDLEEVSEKTGFCVKEICKLHTSQQYTVHALGFQPGFAFLGTLPAQLQVPRRSIPRVRVPANCVAIAADQTAIYPHESPGGWHIIGFTKRNVFDVDSESLSIFQVGDSVQFLDIDEL